MSKRLDAIKSIFTGKSYISSTPNMNSTVQSSTYVKVLNDFFGFYNNYDNRKFLASYGENPLVYMVVNKIAETAASLDIAIVNEEGEKIEGDSVILDLLDNAKLRQEIQESFLLCGNAYILHTMGFGGLGNELEVLKVQLLELELNSMGDLVRYKYTTPSGTVYYYDPEEVCHLSTSNVVNVGSTSILQGLSPLQAAWTLIQSSTEKFSASASIFKNRGIIGILTNKSDAPMIPKERERLQDELDSEMGGSDRFNKIKISTSDLSYIQTGMSPTDLKLLEGLMTDLRLICAIYGMPSILFNDNDASTYNNVSEAKITAYSDVYVPTNNIILSGLTEFLNGRLNTDDRIVTDVTTIEELKATTNRLLQIINSMDSRVAAEFIKAMTIDELRAVGELEGLNNNELVATLNGKETNSEADTGNQGQESTEA